MEKVESKDRSENVAEYAERWNGGVFELMAYSGKIYVNSRDYSCCLVIPLPQDFDLTDLNISERNLSRQNLSILITEKIVRKGWKGRKRKTPFGAFLGGKVGKTEVGHVICSSSTNRVWISKKKFMEITERNMYVDKFYISKLFK